jgi:hypothetical protein
MSEQPCASCAVRSNAVLCRDEGEQLVPGDTVGSRSPIPPAVGRLDGWLEGLPGQLCLLLPLNLQIIEELQKHHPGQVWDSARRELQQIQADLQRLNQDQDRIRKNLNNTPKEADVYKTYLKKLSDQEKEIDILTAKQKQLMTDEFAARKSFEDFLANLSD